MSLHHLESLRKLSLKESKQKEGAKARICCFLVVTPIQSNWKVICAEILRWNSALVN